MEFSRFLITALILFAFLLEVGRCAPPSKREEPDKPDSESSDTPDNPPLKRGKRRVAMKDEEHLWGLGQVPYSWATDIPHSEADRLVIESNMAKISSETCITFHEWYPGIEEDNPGMKPGRLLVGAYPGCWSFVGYQGTQNISTCTYDNTPQHEFGHALGLQHENQSPDRYRYMKAFPEHWGKQNDWSDLDLLTMSDEYSNYGIRYDMESRMGLSALKRGADGRITFDTYDSNARHLFSESTFGLSFLDYKAINLAYKCFETFCEDETLTCENEGYPTYAGGECKCSCPPSIAGDRCEKVETVPASKEWPSGNYGLPMPVDTGCPAGWWSTGQRVHKSDKHDTSFSTDSPELRPQWRSGDRTNVYFDFCIKEGTGWAEQWPKGTYCVYKVGDSCPSGAFKEGSLQFLGGKGVSKTGKLPSGTFTDKETKLEFCCRSDRQGRYGEPMLFPHTKPFYLFSPTSSCQEVQGMIHKRQFVWMGISNNKVVEPIPYHMVYYGTIFMYMCYYYPITDGPGEVFELTPDDPEKIITSQGYPNMYPRGLQQHWLAKVPKGGLVQLDFLDFDVYYNATDEQCIDYMEPSIYGIEFRTKRKFCGNLSKKTVTSKTNYMLIRFLSQSIAGATGFKIKVKGIFPHQLCYKLSDSGTSYRGTVSYTQYYKPCLPWDEVRHCPYNTFDVRSIGSGIAGNNYCRNPNGITQPWCYTDTDQCLSDVCDACLLDRCLDAYDDCAESIASDWDYCTSNPTAFSGCQLSCGFCETPDPVLSCSDPPTSESAIFLGPWKSQYSVGDVVEYECKESGIKGGMKRTCLSDGSWSYSSSECSGCKTGYEEFDGLCYKFYREYYGFEEAIEKCKSDDPSYYPAATNDLRKKEIMDEILLRQKDKTQFLHTGLFIQDDGKPKWTDGSDFVFEKWMPWHKDIVPTSFPAGKMIVNYRNSWHIESKSYTSSLVCEGKTLGEKKCSDRQSDCQQLLARNPDVCLKEIAFARKQCRWSCGVCKDSAYPGQYCAAPTTIGEATLIGTNTFLSLGETAQYKCSSGYVSLGHLERVCLADGSLGGTDPECVSEKETPYVIGRDHLYLQDDWDTVGSMNIHASLKVPKASKAVAFNFYSKHDSQIAFQAWRKTGSTSFVLIGENIVTTKKDQQMYVKIAPEEQILLKKGDYIGWKNLKSSFPPLTYRKCLKKYMPNYDDIFYQVPDAYRKSFQISESVNFNLMVGECRNYSLEVVGHPVPGGDENLCEVPAVSNAIVSHPYIIEEGTEVSIKCLTSYTATNGATDVTCLRSGLWSAEPVQCYRPKLTAESIPCVFPFIVNGASHMDCVSFPPWCATTENYDNDEQSGLCDVECRTTLGPKQPGQSWTIEEKTYFCDEGGTIQPIPAPIKTVNGYDCFFPWKMGNRYYGTCYQENPDEPPSCSLTADYYSDWKSGYCSQVTCTTQNGARVRVGDSWEHEGQSFFCNEESKIILIPEPEVETVRGKFCGFPYFYRDKWYGTCNTIGEDEPWCSLNSGDFYAKREWEFCATQICTTQTGTRAHAGDLWEYQDDYYFCNEESKIMPIPEPVVETEVKGTFCGFPYLYRGKWYGTCNTIGEDKPWCSLNSGDYSVKREFGFCAPFCTTQTGTKVHAGDSWVYQDDYYFCNEESKTMPIPAPAVETQVSGVYCGFPYFYQNKWYGTCNTIGKDKPWCSLNSGNFDDKREWGFCDTQICITQTGYRAREGDSWGYQGKMYFCNEEPKIMLVPEPVVETEVEGTYCGFPYFYQSKWYGTCNMIGEDRPWCSLNSGNYYLTRKWGYCKQ